MFLFSTIFSQKSLKDNQTLNFLKDNETSISSKIIKPSISSVVPGRGFERRLDAGGDLDPSLLPHWPSLWTSRYFPQGYHHFSLSSRSIYERYVIVTFSYIHPPYMNVLKRWSPHKYSVDWNFIFLSLHSQMHTCHISPSPHFFPGYCMVTYAIISSYLSRIF